MAKWQGYSLNLCNVTYFKKEENEFVETTLEAFTLYLDRYKQKDGVSKCIDIVTGRVFYLKEDDTKVTILPSGITVDKRFLVPCPTLIKEGVSILDDEEKESTYTRVSEDVIINTYFCKKLKEIYNLEKIPVSFLKEENSVKKVRKM